MKNNQNYFCGIDSEKIVAQKLRKMGASRVAISPGSRGYADVVAEFDSRKRLGVQVKATCQDGGRVKNLSKSERKRLLKESKRDGITPVIAKVNNGKIESMKYANSNKTVKGFYASNESTFLNIALAATSLFVSYKIYKNINNGRIKFS